MTRGGGRRPTPRTARVAEAIRVVVAEQLERRDDDRLGLLTVTSVEITTDLREATVFYTTSREERGRLRDATPEEASETAAALQGALPHLLPALGARVRLRYLPRLTFRLDHSPAIGARVEEIIQGWQAGEPHGDAFPGGAVHGDVVDRGAAQGERMPTRGDHLEREAVQGEWHAER